MKFVTNLDLQGNQLLNARIQNLAAAPANPTTGQPYYNTADNRTYVYNGTKWVDISASEGGTLHGVTLTGVPTIKTDKTKALGTAAEDAFKIVSSDDKPLFEVKKNGDTVISGVLTVNGTGDSTFAGNVNIGGNLRVDGTISGGTQVNLGRDLDVEGNLNVKGNTVLGDDPTQDSTLIKGFTKITSKANKATGGAAVPAFKVESKDALSLFEVMENGDAKIAGILTVSAVNSTGGAGGTPGTELTGNTVVDNLLVRQNLTVNGNTILGDNALSDTTTIKGVTTIQSKTTKAAGSSAAAAFAVKSSTNEELFQVMENGDTVIAGVLKVKGTGESEFAGNVKIGGNLTVEGSATVKGIMSGNDFRITGNLMVDGNTTLGDNSAQDSVNILGMTTIKTAGVKTATNAATTSVFKLIDAATTPATLFEVRQNGDTHIGGNLVVSGDVNGGGTSTKDLVVDGNLTVKGNTVLGDAAGDSIVVEGTTTFKQNVALSGKRITGLAEPTQATDAATKNYVDAVKTGLDMKESVRVATTGNITLTGLQTVDGIALAAGDRVLVKNQTTKAQNGIYVVASGAWTRATDADNIGGSEVRSGLFTFVEDGSTYANSGWVLSTLNPITIGNTGLDFVQFSGAGSFEAGTGLTKDGNTINVNGTANRITTTADTIDIASTYVGQTSITTLGSVTTGTWNATTIAIAKGGTGATTAAAARTNLGATGKYASDIGNGTASSFTVAHNLGSQDVVVSVREKATNQMVMADIEHTDANNVKISFGSVPAASSYRVVIVG